MKNHGKKIAGVILIVLCLVAYLAAVGIVVMQYLKIPYLLKVIVFIVSGILAIMLIFVLIERIKEIRSGEEDDLGQY